MKGFVPLISIGVAIIILGTGCSKEEDAPPPAKKQNRPNNNHTGNDAVKAADEAETGIEDKTESGTEDKVETVKEGPDTSDTKENPQEALDLEPEDGKTDDNPENRSGP